MLFKFIGQHTNGHTSITYGNVTFEGDEPADVENADLIRRLSGSPEFEVVDPLDHDGNGAKGGSLPKRRAKKDTSE